MPGNLAGHPKPFNTYLLPYKPQLKASLSSATNRGFHGSLDKPLTAVPDFLVKTDALVTVANSG